MQRRRCVRWSEPLVLFALIASPCAAECYRPQGAAPCEQKCIEKGPCIVMMTGAGMVNEGNLRYRAEWNRNHAPVSDRQIAIFRPSGGVFGVWSYWTAKDIEEVRRFVTARQALGEDLNFVISSAAVGRFENEIWPDLPPVVGTVVINQPFHQPGEPKRGVLKAGVKPKFFVVYTLDMSPGEIASHDAGPSRFEDKMIRWNYVVLNGRKLSLNHGKAVGRCEELAFALMPPFVHSDRSDAYLVVRDHIERFGVRERSIARDPIPNCWTEDYTGKPRGKGDAEAASMTGFVAAARKVLLVGDGAGVREAYKILTDRLGVEGVVWDPNINDQKSAMHRAMSMKVKPDAVLGFLARERDGGTTAKEKRGGVYAEFEISESDFQERRVK